MAAEEIKSSESRQNPPKTSPQIKDKEIKDSILSPRFRSAAAMAGWDEEALLVASLVVEDTPVRESKHKKRPSHQFKTPPTTNSNRKRRSRRRSSNYIPPVILCLDDEEVAKKEDLKEKTKETDVVVDEEKKMEDNLDKAEKDSGVGQLPCLDRLREELSCAICLEICFEPSTTPCGHSFCKKCLKHAAVKCGRRCPKCRQLISNGRSCTVNTVLWNTIQLLFPNEVEVRKHSVATPPPEGGSALLASSNASSEIRSSSIRRSNRSRMEGLDMDRGGIRRRAVPSQSEDAALALRLQREEFMEVFREGRDQQRDELQRARTNLSSLASRARSRGRLS